MDSNDKKNLNISKTDGVEFKIDDLESEKFKFNVESTNDVNLNQPMVNSEINSIPSKQLTENSEGSSITNDLVQPEDGLSDISSSEYYNGNNSNDFDMNDIFDNNTDDFDQGITNDGYDAASLKERIQDFKDDANQLKEDIQKLPQDIKEKKDELKNKAINAKEKIKRTPENIKNQVSQAKEKSQNLKNAIKNIPKSKEDIPSAVKNRLKNTAKKAKQKMEETAKRAQEKGKTKLKDSIQNSKPVRAINKTKKAVQNIKKNVKRVKRAIKIARKVAKMAVKMAKTTIKLASNLIKLIIEASPWSELIILCVIVIILLIIAVAAIFKPGKFNINIGDQGDSYSETDLKTLNKLRDLYNKYPNADAALAMITVIYPYYDSLQSGDVKIFIDTTDKNWDPSKTYEDYEDLSEEDYGDEQETEDNENIDEETVVGDDIYLELFKKWSYRRKFKKLLKESDSKTEDEFIQYLKDEYFTSEAGYKYLYSFVEDEDIDAFTEAIINDLKDNKSYFMDYIYNQVVCTSSSTSLGYSYAGDVISGEPVVVLKDSSSGSFKTIKESPSLYGTEDLSLSLKRYVMGVAYAEVGGNIKKEAVVKSVMISAKSFVLGRTAPGSSEAGDVGKNFVPEQINGKTVFYMRGSTADQDFCDVYEGCQNGSRYAKNLQKQPLNKETIKNVKAPLDTLTISNLEKWYDETANEFIYDGKKQAFAGSQYNDYNSNCKVGSCLSQTKAVMMADQGKDYVEILYGDQGAFSDSKFEKFDMATNTLIKVSSSCDGISVKGLCGIPNNKFIYYNQKDYQNQFCGRKDGATIKTSGCGITSMAMVIANLTNYTNITPIDTMNEAYSYGYCGENIIGTKAAYFSVAASNYGLTYKYLTKDSNGIKDALNILKSGGLIIANVGSLSPFTTGGHYIVIRMLDGQSNVYVADPYHKELFTTPYDINDFINKKWITSGWWGFTSNKSTEIVGNYCQTVNKLSE